MDGWTKYPLYSTGHCSSGAAALHTIGQFGKKRKAGQGYCWPYIDFGRLFSLPLPFPFNFLPQLIYLWINCMILVDFSVQLGRSLCQSVYRDPSVDLSVCRSVGLLVCCSVGLSVSLLGRSVHTFVFCHFLVQPKRYPDRATVTPRLHWLWQMTLIRKGIKHPLNVTYMFGTCTVHTRRMYATCTAHERRMSGARSVIFERTKERKYQAEILNKRSWILFAERTHSFLSHSFPFDLALSIELGSDKGEKEKGKEKRER